MASAGRGEEESCASAGAAINKKRIGGRMRFMIYGD
jgi:hypothetical protein